MAVKNHDPYPKPTLEPYGNRSLQGYGEFYGYNESGQLDYHRLYAKNIMDVVPIDAGNGIGQLVYWDGSKWAKINAGATGELLHGTGASVPEWSGKTIHHTYHAYSISAGDTGIKFIPNNSTSENSSSSSATISWVRLIAPHDGKLVSVKIISSIDVAATTWIRFHRNTGAYPTSIIESESIGAMTALAAYTETFTSSTFSAGDMMAVSVALGNTTANPGINIVATWEYDITT